MKGSNDENESPNGSLTPPPNTEGTGVVLLALDDDTEDRFGIGFIGSLDIEAVLKLR